MKRNLLEALNNLKIKYQNEERYVVMNQVITDTLQIVNRYDNYDYIQSELSNKINEVKYRNPALTRYPDKYEHCMLKIKSIVHSFKNDFM